MQNTFPDPGFSCPGKKFSIAGHKIRNHLIAALRRRFIVPQPYFRTGKIIDQLPGVYIAERPGSDQTIEAAEKPGAEICLFQVVKIKNFVITLPFIQFIKQNLHLKRQIRIHPKLYL